MAFRAFKLNSSDRSNSHPLMSALHAMGIAEEVFATLKD
jgi:hypothetical protein